MKLRAEDPQSTSRTRSGRNDGGQRSADNPPQNRILCISQVPARGFLGTGATFGADLNLVVQLIMGVSLVVGTVLARRKRYRAHGICQTTVILLNLLMIGLVMGPSFLRQVKPALSKVTHKWYYEVAALHGALGIVAELLGLYIVIVAGTDALPHWLRATHWKWWMRTELLLGAIVLLGGVGTYCAWYVAPFR